MGLEFAPSPWRRGIGNDCHTVFDSQGRIVAQNCRYDDGNLISASPGLLAACEKLLRHVTDGTIMCGIVAGMNLDKTRDEARAAIAKAKGGAA